MKWVVNHCIEAKTDAGERYGIVQVQADRGYHHFPVPIEDAPKYRAGQMVSITVQIEEEA